MNKIVYGSRVFTDHEIESGNVHIATNLISAQLEANTFTAVVRSGDATLTDFERNAKLIFYIDNKQSGIFYVQSIDRVSDGKYKIFATSAVGLLIEGQHMGGIYTGQTAQEIVADICGSVPFIIKNNLSGTKLYGWLPIASPRDNLSQVLFAIGAALKTDLDGVLRIAGLWDGVSGSTPKERMYEGGKIEYSSKITQIILTEHQYSEGSDVKKLFDGTAQEGDIITFNAPMHSLQVTGITIRASGANWAKVSSGSGTLTGKEYIHNTRLITRDVQTANAPNVKKVEKATLISLVNSAATADRLVSFYKCTETINSSVVYRGENTGNIMSTYHPFDQSAVNACLQTADITLSKTLKAREKSLVGFEPLRQENVEIFDKQEIITQSGTWTVPEGVTRIRAVLIGGGQGGGAGHDGEKGADGTSVYVSSGQTGQYTGQNGYGGNGGDGGLPGHGGNIKSVDLEVVEGTVFTVSIGAGGLGGETAGEAGAIGGDTTFSSDSDSATSADGSFGSYVDVTTGNVYGVAGATGKAGAKGGKGATKNVTAENGESVAPFAGGSCGGNSYRKTTSSAVNSYPTVTQSLGSISTTKFTSSSYWKGYKSNYSIASDGVISVSGEDVAFYLGMGAKTGYGGMYSPSNPSPTVSNPVVTSYVDKAWTTLADNNTEAKKQRINVRRAYKVDTVNLERGTWASGGGGAAYGASGNGAVPAQISSSYADSIGGSGGNAQTPSGATVYGQGGDGGNGGGGGGGGGAGDAYVTGTPGNNRYNITGYGGTGGAGGKGSKGGNGAPGCVILYYGVPRKIGSGRFVDKNGKQFLEKFTRRFIV